MHVGVWEAAPPVGVETLLQTGEETLKDGSQLLLLQSLMYYSNSGYRARAEQPTPSFLD